MDTQTHPKPKMWTFKDNDLVFGRRRRLRYLMPKTTTNVKDCPPCPFLASSFYTSLSMTNAFSRIDHHLRKEEGINMREAMVSSRWNPTQEQLKALEEMYERGVRTPSAEEIQLIAAKLRLFGKIEGKNVFYWFQNHKARERQKRRRQPDFFSDKNMQHNQTPHTSFGRNYLETEQNKKFVPTSSCSLASLKGLSANSSMPELQTAVTESRPNKKSRHRRTAKSEETLDENYLMELQNCSREINKLLQLFPVRGDDPIRTSKEGEEEEEVTITLNHKFTPNHFYEFL